MEARRDQVVDALPGRGKLRGWQIKHPVPQVRLGIEGL